MARHTVTLDCRRLPLVRDVGYGKALDFWTHPDRNLEFNVFLFIIDGRFQVIEDGIEYELSPGEIFFLKSGIHHWGLPKTLPGTSWRWIHFFDSPTDAESLKEFGMYTDKSILLTPEHLYCKLTMPKRWKVSQPNYYSSKIRAIGDAYQSQSAHRSLIVSLKTAELFMELHQEAAHSRTENRNEVIVRKIIDTVEMHGGGKLKSESIANALNMNYNYLSSVFKKKIGVSITEYHAMVRIKKAIDLLKQPGTNISEVSYRLGFSNPYHFSRIFKKVTGISPSQYMNQIYK